MKLTRIINQYRRDFQGEYQCEFCGHIDKDEYMVGYDDRNYHDNVIPNMECLKCGKSTISGGGEIENTQTKYPDGFQI